MRNSEPVLPNPIQEGGRRGTGGGMHRESAASPTPSVLAKVTLAWVVGPPRGEPSLRGRGRTPWPGRPGWL